MTSDNIGDTLVKAHKIYCEVKSLNKIGIEFKLTPPCQDSDYWSLDINYPSNLMQFRGGTILSCSEQFLNHVVDIARKTLQVEDAKRKRVHYLIGEQ